MIDNTAAYNDLPLFQELAPDTTSELSKLGSLVPLVESMGMNETIGFVRLHRHFTTDPGKATIWQVSGSQVISQMAATRPSLDIPIVWQISQTGNVAPLEFLATNSVEPGVAASLAAVPNSHAFIKLANVMAIIGLNHAFGVSLMPRVIADMSGAKPLMQGLMLEQSDRARKSSILSPSMSMDAMGLPTLWVARRGSLIILAGCTTKSNSSSC